MKHLNPLRLCALTITFSSTLAAAVQTPSTCRQPAPWRRFTNQLVSYIWGEEQTPRRCDQVPNTDIVGTGSRPQNAVLSARYGQDMVLRFNVSTVEETRAIAEAAEDLYLDIWEFSDNWVDIRLAKDILPSFLGLLPTSLQSSHAPLIPDTALVELISGTLSTDDVSPFSPELRSSSKDVFFSDYQPLSVIEPWMRLLSSLFSTHVRVISVGKSYEGRDISAFKVGVHPTNDAKPNGPRKTIIIMGGIHAREWISVSSVNYIANQIISSYGKSKLTTKLLESFDLILIPTLNPDGYAYSWDTDRLWRKNRQPTQLRFCNGIDIDRSFGFEWDGDARPGNPCSESFAGDAAWQATEAKEFAAWAKNETENNNVEFVALLDLHSYSQQVLYPYSFSCKAAPPTLEDLEELALGLAKSMRVVNHGHSYRARSACEGNVYLADDAKATDEPRLLPRVELGGGSALDWLYHELKIPYAYQIKLRDMGSYGFLLPKQNIVPQGKELMGAVEYLGRFLLGEIGFNKDELTRPEDQVLLTRPILDEESQLQLEL